MSAETKASLRAKKLKNSRVSRNGSIDAYAESISSASSSIPSLLSFSALSTSLLAISLHSSSLTHAFDAGSYTFLLKIS
jgi:hypothetical protein